MSAEQYETLSRTMHQYRIEQSGQVCRHPVDDISDCANDADWLVRHGVTLTPSESEPPALDALTVGRAVDDALRDEYGVSDIFERDILRIGERVIARLAATPPAKPSPLDAAIEYGLERLMDMAESIERADGPGRASGLREVIRVLHRALAGEANDLLTAVGAACPYCHAKRDPRQPTEAHRPSRPPKPPKPPKDREYA